MDHTSHECKYTGLDREYGIEDLAAFHGHLGPYIVLGYRIGRYVRRNFCSDPFQMKAAVHCTGQPPQSCLADGVQIGSGCTLGKRNIEIVPSGELFCKFSCGGREIIIRPKHISFPQAGREDYGLLIERLAENMYSMPEAGLFAAELK